MRTQKKQVVFVQGKAEKVEKRKFFVLQTGKKSFAMSLIKPLSKTSPA